MVKTALISSRERRFYFLLKRIGYDLTNCSKNLSNFLRFNLSTWWVYRYPFLFILCMPCIIYKSKQIQTFVANFTKFSFSVTLRTVQKKHLQNFTFTLPYTSLQKERKKSLKTQTFESNLKFMQRTNMKLLFQFRLFVHATVLYWYWSTVWRSSPNLMYVRSSKNFTFFRNTRRVFSFCLCFISILGAVKMNNFSRFFCVYVCMYVCFTKIT